MDTSCGVGLIRFNTEKASQKETEAVSLGGTFEARPQATQGRVILPTVRLRGAFCDHHAARYAPILQIPAKFSVSLGR
jgi:hypothetical protein